jgi:two-component system response regulator PhoP
MVNEFEVLLVEDDAAVRERLANGLQNQGFTHVVAVRNAREAYRAMLGQQFGAVVIGHLLSDESASAMTGSLRGVTDAVIVLLGSEGMTQREHVQALEHGADAFLTHPVNLPLLAATVRSALRRRERLRTTQHVPLHANGWRTGLQMAATTGDGWQLLSEGWLLRSPSGQNVRLSTLERSLMSLLLDHRGRVVARGTIAARLSDSQHDFDPHRIEVLVHRLRRKVLKQGCGELPLSAVRGSGYVFTY